MYTVVGESIKSGLGQELKKLFPNINWYKEQITKVSFPHFFIYQLTLNKVEERKNYYWLSYFITIRYRVSSEPTTISTLQQQLDETSLKLLLELDTIKLFTNIDTIDDYPVKLTDTRTEKIDGILHYFCNVKIQIKKTELGTIKQGILIINEGIK